MVPRYQLEVTKLASKPRNLPRGINLSRRMRKGREVTLYDVRVTWQGRRELVGRFDTLGDAKVAKLLADADILRGTFVPPRAARAAWREQAMAERDSRLNGYKVKDLAEDWLVHVERMGAKQSTLYTYRKRVERHVLPHLGDVPAEAVTPKMVEQWFDKLDSEHGNGVSRGSYMMLSGMFAYATGEARGQSPDFEPIVKKSPCRVAGATIHKPVRPAGTKDKVLTDEQVKAIAAGMPDGERLAVLLGGFLALRIGEVLGLQRGDIEGKRLHIRRALQSRGQGLRLDTPKTKAGTRVLPIPTALQQVLDDHLADYVGEGDDAPLFPRAVKGSEYLHPNVLRAHFSAAIAKANDAIDRRNATLKAKEPLIPEGFVFHGLRHTALTRLGEAGATLEELKEWAGHTDSATVQRYQHATAKRLASLSEVVSERIGESEEL